MKENCTIVEYIEALGWKEIDIWNNRILYRLNEYVTYYLFEHNGKIGIYHDQEYIYCNLNENEISRLSDILLERYKMFMNPKDYSLYQAIQNSVSIERLEFEFRSKTT